MPDKLRTFIAVPMRATRPLKELLERLTTMGSAVRPLYFDNLHVTLKFLGETDPADVTRIAAIVEQAVEGVSAFEARLDGLGAFPHARRPSVVWAGLQNAESLSDVVRRLERELKRLGFPKERRKFAPHVTLARVRSRAPDALMELLAEHAAASFGTARIDCVIHYRSDLKTTGALYTPLFTRNLTG
ncbi:MAG: RNA 2',3'-cyclic phosphodiesterase [Planctomycetes bacterium]|nr:RNA 2',3'-cyclic phosphodiesterase [Planctomycetota bacterium]